MKSLWNFWVKTWIFTQWIIVVLHSMGVHSLAVSFRIGIKVPRVIGEAVGGSLHVLIKAQWTAQWGAADGRQIAGHGMVESLTV